VYGEELYDHRLDSGEELNLVPLPQFDDVRQRLRRRLMEMVGS